jgi:hypothetical protein
VLPVTSQSHALVNIDFQIHLPALSLFVGTILPVSHGAFLILLGLHNRKAVLHTQLVRCFPKLHQTVLVTVILETGVTADRVDYEVRVDVIPVGVGRYHDFKAGDLICQL